MITLAWKKSAGTLMSWCGTKNPTIMVRPITAVMNSGSSRFIPGSREVARSASPERGSGSLGRQPLSQRVVLEGLEHAAQDHDDQDDELDEVGSLEPADQPGLA